MKVRSIDLLGFAAVTLLLASCGDTPEPTPSANAEKPTSATKTATAKVSAKARPKPTETAAAAPVDPKDMSPETYKVKFETTKGDFEVECKREWAPKAADRFYKLVKEGFYDDNALFRVVKKPEPFVVQWGIAGDPAKTALWKDKTERPDPVKQSNTRGTLTFAMGGMPKTFTTQVFINFNDSNARLDKMGFAPVCLVTGNGMDVVDKFNSEYEGKASDEQPRIEAEGNAFLKKEFPNLDYIKTAKLVGDDSAPPAASGSAAASAGPSASAPASAKASAGPSASASAKPKK